MKYFKKIESERLFLAPIMVEDAETYCEWLNDPSTSDGINQTQNLITLEGEKEYIETLTKKGGYNFSVVKKEGEKLIGNCTLAKVDSINQCAEIGLMIGEESERNKGYGKEIINMLLDYGFNTLNLHNIEIGVFSFNKRAIACYKKVGFKEAGRVRENKFHQGKRYDSITLDMLKDEFNQ